MTISQYISALEDIKRKHGDVQVYFDCPKCEISFVPNKIITMAIHIIEKK